VNSDDFRALVRQRFERWMSDLYVRGAFQGRTPEAGYRVVVDESVNPPLSVQQGRLLVELRVAPSRPFHYINVRLLQTAPERLTTSEA
jgi:phage tail sheath protein FI